MRITKAFFTILFILLLSQAALAKGLMDKNIHYFQPPVDGSGLIVSYGSEPLGMFHMYYAAFADDSMNILRYQNYKDYPGVHPGDTSAVQAATLAEFNKTQTADTVAIPNQLGLSLLWGMGILDFINVGLAIPYIPTRSFDKDYTDNKQYPPAPRKGVDASKIEGPKLFDDNTLAANEDTKNNALEDLRLDIKLIGLDRMIYCLGAGLLTSITFPVAYKPNQYTSDGGSTVSPRLVLDLGRTWWTIVFNGGVKIYSEKSRVLLPPYSKEMEGNQPNPGDLYTNNEYILGGGVKFQFSYGDEILFDSQARTQVNAPFNDKRVDYVEVMGAYRKTFRGLNFTRITIGGGVGLTQGIGSPTGRFFIGLARDEKRLQMMYY